MRFLLACFSLAVLVINSPASAGDYEAELAQKISEPVPPVVNIPIKLTYDDNIGASDAGYKWTLKFEPVVPMNLSTDWTLLSRTIVPVMYQANVFGHSEQMAVGDVTQSFFFRPNNIYEHTKFGIGPVFQLPTSTDVRIGDDKWGVGPTAFLIDRSGPWKYGFLTNQVWSVAGSSTHAYVSDTLFQPFMSYNTPTAWTYNLQSESHYDWHDGQASVPLDFTVSKLVEIDETFVSFSGGAGYWLAHSDNGAEGWRFKLGMTFVVPE